MFGFHQPLVTGWWLKNNLEKYEFTNGKDDIPYIVENKICSKPPNHLSSLVKGLCECPFFQILAVSMDWSKGTSTGNHGFSNMKSRGQSMYSGDYLQYDSGSAYAYAYGYGYGMYGGFLTWGYPCSSSISIVFYIINHPFWGSPIYETHIYIYTHITVNMYINHHFMGFSHGNQPSTTKFGQRNGRLRRYRPGSKRPGRGLHLRGEGQRKKQRKMVEKPWKTTVKSSNCWAMTIILSTSIAVELPQGLGLVWEKTSKPDIARIPFIMSEVTCGRLSSSLQFAQTWLANPLFLWRFVEKSSINGDVPLTCLIIGW